MDFELLVRYLVPGTLAVAPTVLWTLFSPDGSNLLSGLGGLIVAVTIPAGYLIHQLWFSIFNLTGGYVSPRRPNLDYLIKKYREETGVTPSVRHAYFAWEDWVYGGTVPQGHLQRARRLWQLYHGLRSCLIAMAIGLMVLVAQYMLGYLPAWPAFFAAVLYVLAAAHIYVHSLDIRRQVDEWELMMAVEDATQQQEASKLLADVQKFIRVLSAIEGPSTGFNRRRPT